ncbi:MAG: hypothetical protein Tsb0013_24140 [Phycisphaerales bacterium]
MGPVALGVAVYYTVLSLVSIVLYGVDKRAAVKGSWRIKEKTLHTADFLGGWPGGLLAQKLFRHKRRKARFMIVFWAAVVVHALLWGTAAYLWTTA